MAIADMIMRLLREGFIARTQAIGLKGSGIRTSGSGAVPDLVVESNRCGSD